MSEQPQTWMEWLTKSRAQAAATMDAWRQAAATLTTPPKPHPLTTSPEDGGNDV